MYPTTLLASQTAADLKATGTGRRGRPRRQRTSQTSRGGTQGAGPPVPRLMLRAARIGR